MMQGFLKKLKSTCGETLVETLAAVLICGLAAAVLMAGVGVASHMNYQTHQRTQQMQAEENFAAKFEGYLDETGDSNPSHISGRVTFSDKTHSDQQKTISGDGKVKVYGGALVFSYELDDGAWSS